MSDETLQDQRRHLHRESIEGESGILLRDEYRHRRHWSVARGRAYPTKIRGRVNLGKRPRLRSTDLVWDTGSTNFLHGPKTKQRELNDHKEKMLFEGFGENMKAVSSVVAGVAYPQFTVKESHRLDDLGSSNLGAGWTSKMLGFSTMINSKGISCIQTAHNLRRFELIDKEDQPVVGARINEGDGITRGIGWMAVKDKGSLTHFERADGKIVNIKPIAGRPRHQGRSTMVTQDVEQKHCSRLPDGASDEDKCIDDKPAELMQQDEKITLESVHKTEAADASSTWRGMKVESPNSKKVQRN